MFISPLHCLCSCTRWRLRPFCRWLHFHQQIRLCVLYRSQCLFPAFPSNRSKLQQRLNPPHTFFLLDQNITWTVWRRSPPTCSASSFRCPHILMQSLAFRAAALEFGVIQTCHSASHLILQHYHTNTAKRIKGSPLVLGINLSNSRIEPLAPQACR